MMVSYRSYSEAIEPHKSMHVDEPSFHGSGEKSCLRVRSERCSRSRLRVVLQITEPMAMPSTVFTESMDSSIKRI